MAVTTASKSTRQNAPKTPEAANASKAHRGRRPFPKWLGLIIGLGIGAIVWELAGRFFFDPIFFAPLSEVISSLVKLFQTDSFWQALGESLQLFVAGFSIGAILGLVLGVAIGRTSLIAAALESYVTLLYVTPPIALVPFVLSLLGFGYWPKTVIVAWFVFFPVCITTIEGVRSVNPRLIEVAQSFGSSEAKIWRDVLIPSTVPYAMSGIRQGVALGFVGVVAAEFLLDASGIGLLLRTYSRLYQTGNLFAAVLIMTSLGLTVMALGRLLERRFAPWRQ